MAFFSNLIKFFKILENIIQLMRLILYKTRLFYPQENKLAGSILNFPEDAISILNYITRGCKI